MVDIYRLEPFRIPDIYLRNQEHPPKLRGVPDGMIGFIQLSFQDTEKCICKKNALSDKSFGLIKIIFG